MESALHHDWHFIKEKIIKRWPLLNESDLDLARDASDMLIGRLQEHYGLTRDEAEREIQNFLETQVAHAQ